MAPLTNAEKQAAFRERRDAELKRLRHEAAKGAKADAKIDCADALPDFDVIPSFAVLGRFEKGQATKLETLHVKYYLAVRCRRDDVAKLQAEIKALRKQYGKAGTGAAEPAPRSGHRMAKPKNYTREEWRKRLLKIFHPDRYHGTDEEALANEVAAWLNSMKPKRK